jgi:hypothetical protein
MTEVADLPILTEKVRMTNLCALLSSNDKIEGLAITVFIYDEGRHWILLSRALSR